MRVLFAVVAALALAICVLSTAGHAGAAECKAGDGGLGVSRVVDIDASGGPLFGSITRNVKEVTFLEPKEVVLTFDDGPMPWVTRSILDTLDRFCTKATFFSVGRMAVEYPATVKDVLARGHTVGAHTWSHPLNLPRLTPEKAKTEIEKGFAAVSMAAARPIAPFFRFPGLSDSAPLLAYLQTRGIATFTVDVVSNDSYIHDPKRLAQLTLQRVEAQHSGILLFHDIKAATAKALPTILSELKARGYKVVHLTPKEAVKPLEVYDAEVGPILAKAIVAEGSKKTLLPFYGGAGPLKAAGETQPPVTTVAPPPRTRETPRARLAAAGPHAASAAGTSQAETSGWAIRVKRVRRQPASVD